MSGVKKNDFPVSPPLSVKGETSVLEQRARSPQGATRLRTSLWSGLYRLLQHRWAGFGILLVVGLPLTAYRAQLETNFWIDETYSVMLSTHSASRLVRITAADAHPPGYYLALKAWLKAGRVLGLEPAISWARSLNVFFWLLLATAAWFGGRLVAGVDWGPLVAWVVACSALPALVARDLRSYGISTVALFVSFLVLALVVSQDHKEALRPGRLLGLWTLYAAASSLALWTHLLSAVALALLVLLWAALFLRRRHFTPAFIAGAVGANSLVIAGFLPWLTALRQQLEFLQRSQPDWMTPPTAANLARVFTFWYPLGRLGDPASPENRWLVPLGVLAVALPLALGLWALRRLGHSAHPSLMGRTALLGLGVAGSFVTVLWLLHRYGVTHTFHGPRYPSLVANIWSAGLVFLAIWAVSVLGWRRSWATVLLLPWLLSGALGQGILAQRETRWGIANLKDAVREYFPPDGQSLYVMPSELIPYYRESLANWNVRRIEELPCQAEAGQTPVVLNVNYWPGLDHPRDHLARHLIAGSPAVVRFTKLSFPERQKDYTVYRLDEINPAAMATVCRTGLSSKAARTLGAAVSKALPEEQVAGVHWSFLEAGDELTTSRWATSQATPIHFDRPLQPGSYTLNLTGYRSAYPEDPMALGFSLEGTAVRGERTVGAGRFKLDVPVHLEGPLRRPVLWIEHSLWSPAEVGSSSDQRELSFLFYSAWFDDEAGAHTRGF